MGVGVLLRVDVGGEGTLQVAGGPELEAGVFRVPVETGFPGERGDLRGDLRGELTIRIATGRPPAPSADALLDMLGAKLDEVPGEMITSATRSARALAAAAP